MNRSFIASALLLAFAGTAAAQVTLYGRVDLSIAQQADASKNIELRNGSGSRLGVRGSEDLGGGLKAVFQVEHRFNADTGEAGSPFWGGKSIVGIEGGFGRLTLGREENPAYTFGQTVADPWGTDTVASNGSIVNGRIGSTRYSNAVNYRVKAAGFSLGAQVTEGDDQQKRPFSLGLGYAAGQLKLGLGYENPGDADDHWLTLAALYNFGAFELSGLVGNGRNTSAQKHQSWLLGATVPMAGGELRASFGQLKNKDLGLVTDKQLALGYHRPLSKRTTVYVDLVNEKRDQLPANRQRTGWDVGIKHNF